MSTIIKTKADSYNTVDGSIAIQFYKLTITPQDYLHAGRYDHVAYRDAKKSSSCKKCYCPSFFLNSSMLVARRGAIDDYSQNTDSDRTWGFIESLGMDVRLLNA